MPAALPVYEIAQHEQRAFLSPRIGLSEFKEESEFIGVFRLAGGSPLSPRIEETAVVETREFAHEPTLGGRIPELPGQKQRNGEHAGRTFGAKHREPAAIPAYGSHSISIEKFGHLPVLGKNVKSRGQAADTRPSMGSVQQWVVIEPHGLEISAPVETQKALLEGVFEPLVIDTVGIGTNGQIGHL